MIYIIGYLIAAWLSGFLLTSWDCPNRHYINYNNVRRGWYITAFFFWWIVMPCTILFNIFVFIDEFFSGR